MGEKKDMSGNSYPPPPIQWQQQQNEEQNKISGH